MPPRSQRAPPAPQVLQPIAVQLARTAWTEALSLPTVCRRARALTGSRGSPWEPRLGDRRARRRLKEALEQPFWSAVDEVHAARLWRALGRPGAPHPLQLWCLKYHYVGGLTISWRMERQPHNAC